MPKLLQAPREGPCAPWCECASCKSNQPAALAVEYPLRLQTLGPDEAWCLQVIDHVGRVLLEVDPTADRVLARQMFADLSAFVASANLTWDRGPMKQLVTVAQAVCAAATLPSLITPEGHGIVAGALVHHFREAIHAVDPSWKSGPAPAPILSTAPGFPFIRKLEEA